VSPKSGLGARRREHGWGVSDRDGRASTEDFGPAYDAPKAIRRRLLSELGSHHTKTTEWMVPGAPDARRALLEALELDGPVWRTPDAFEDWEALLVATAERPRLAGA
jgi:hypothetical protein